MPREEKKKAGTSDRKVGIKTRHFVECTKETKREEKKSAGYSIVGGIYIHIHPSERGGRARPLYTQQVHLVTFGGYVQL